MHETCCKDVPVGVAHALLLPARMKDVRAWLFGSRSLRSLHFAVRPGVLAYHLGLLLIPLAALGFVPASVAWATGRTDVALTHLAVAAGFATLGVCGRKLGRRRALDRGELMLVTVDPSGPWSAMHLLLRAVSGSLAKQEKAYQHRCAQAIDIDTRRHQMRVALDGEPLRLRPPLHFRSRPASLRLRGTRTVT